jgi:hypothetical protein
MYVRDGHDEKGTQIVRTLGGDQEVLVVSESGLYFADLPVAQIAGCKSSRPAMQSTASRRPFGADTVTAAMTGGLPG